MVLMFILGCAFGSFLCCQARRIHLKEITRKVLKTKKKSTTLGSRSVCLHCHKKLKWYDNIPVVSWLVLKGKCRFCHKKIGVGEILSEVLVGVGFLILSTTVNIETATALEWAKFITVMIFATTVFFLAIYDGLYGEMPTIILTFSVLCAIITLIPQMWTGFLVDPFLSGLLYGGLYLLLYIVSKGKWVGDGDWIIALAIGLVLGKPWLSLVALFIANFSACLVMLPFLKKSKNHQIYFGPFLVFSFVITYALSEPLLSVIAVTTGAF